MSRYFSMDKNKGVKLRSINICMAVVTVIVAAIIITSSLSLDGKYKKLREAQDDYLKCDKAATDLQDGSDTLTRSVQLFVETGKIEYLYKYFDEVTSRRRENAVEAIDATAEENAVLLKAMNGSQNLMELEYHIMKLMVDARGLYSDAVPSVVSDYVLTDEEIKASPEEKVEMARGLVFGSTYIYMKSYIDYNIDLFLSNVLNRQKSVVKKLSADVRNDITRMNSYIIMMVVVNFVISMIYYKKVIIVLNRFVNSIESDESLDGNGVYELNYLSSVYNKNHKQVVERTEELKHRATHDDLTGLYSRNELESYVRHRIESKSVKVGTFVLIDIDSFKSINDVYGHDIGDKVLCRLGKILFDECGIYDRAGRLGGDEFVIWVEFAERNDQKSIERIDRINSILNKPEGELPPISISAGIVYYEGDSDFHNLYIKADKALYCAKNKGKCCCVIYKENI